MISKVTVNDFNESAGIRILKDQLEKNLRIKTYFTENDKTPNTDGYFEILSAQGTPLKRFVVQIKTARKLAKLKNGDYSYSVDTAFFQYVLENIDQNPAVFFLVDLSNSRIYYKHLSLGYIISLSIGDREKTNLRLDSSDVLNEEAFYNFCMNLFFQMRFERSYAINLELLPTADEEFHYEHFDELDITTIIPWHVGFEEGKKLRIPPEIFEKYDVFLLAKGGISTVFLLVSKTTASRSIMKVASLNKYSGTLLFNEFSVLNRLRHSSVPKVWDYYSDDETEYLIMEYIDGHSLNELASQGAFNLAEIIAVIANLCEVTNFLHHNGIIHRDIKPSNIIVGHSHSVTLLDFDIALTLNDTLTQDVFAGTMRYAAPETFGRVYGNVQSDIYSIGATLYHSLRNEVTKVFLDSINSGSVLSEYISDFSGEELGYGLTVLRKSLALNPEERYKSAMKMKNDLMLWQEKECIHPSVLSEAMKRSKEICFSRIRK